MTGFKEEIQKVKSEIQAEMGEMIKDSRTEIEQDLITPLKNKMAMVDEKADGTDKKMDTLTAGMKLLLERNETAPAPAPAFAARPKLPAWQLPFYKPRQPINGCNRQTTGNGQALPSREQLVSNDKQVRKRHYKHEELTAE